MEAGIVVLAIALVGLAIYIISKRPAPNPSPQQSMVGSAERRSRQLEKAQQRVDEAQDRANFQIEMHTLESQDEYYQDQERIALEARLAHLKNLSKAKPSKAKPSKAKSKEAKSGKT